MVTLNGVADSPQHLKEDRKGSRDPAESGPLCLVPSEEASSTLTTVGNLMTHTEGRRKEAARRRRWKWGQECGHSRVYQDLEAKGRGQYRGGETDTGTASS
jgi:hypothetical protein